MEEEWRLPRFICSGVTIRYSMKLSDTIEKYMEYMQRMYVHILPSLEILLANRVLFIYKNSCCCSSLHGGPRFSGVCRIPDVASTHLGGPNHRFKNDSRNHQTRRSSSLRAAFTSSASNGPLFLLIYVYKTKKSFIRQSFLDFLLLVLCCCPVDR